MAVILTIIPKATLKIVPASGTHPRTFADLGTGASTCLSVSNFNRASCLRVRTRCSRIRALAYVLGRLVHASVSFGASLRRTNTGAVRDGTDSKRRTTFFSAIEDVLSRQKWVTTGPRYQLGALSCDICYSSVIGHCGPAGICLAC
jgi:hypothetical protein